MANTSEKFAELENKLATQALIIFGRILNELDTSSFTLDDISEAFVELTDNNPAGDGRLLVPDEEHLRYLLRKGLIVFDEETQSYAVRGEADILNDFWSETDDSKSRDALRKMKE